MDMEGSWDLVRGGPVLPQVVHVERHGQLHRLGHGLAHEIERFLLPPASPAAARRSGRSAGSEPARAKGVVEIHHRLLDEIRG
jgi:hypothetical protein